MKIVLHNIGHLERIVNILTKAGYEFQPSADAMLFNPSCYP